MQLRQAKVIFIAETNLSRVGVELLEEELGATTNWRKDPSPNDGERLIELGGRLCYRSFDPGLNENVTKVREGNREYIGNILKQKHGSVLEHSNVTFALMNVSRILTHELVRHRAGCAFSQESMRFVRLDNIPMYIPNLTEEFEELAQYQEDTYIEACGSDWANSMQSQFNAACESVTHIAERLIAEIASSLDKPKVPFDLKKKVTSALRRMAPGGHTTNILVTANHRAWRHILEMRTTEHTEEEPRRVVNMIGHQLLERYPAIYQDFIIDPEQEVQTWFPINSKV